jgi:hypothetical protein
MRLIGKAERALELMCRRVCSGWRFRPAAGRAGVIQEWIAESRVRIEQGRLLVLKTAWLMDTVGNRGAHTEIQAIKIAIPLMAEWVIDKAIQAHGAAGVSQDTVLAALWANTRTLRLADGPDESTAHRSRAESCGSTATSLSRDLGLPVGAGHRWSPRSPVQADSRCTRWVSSTTSCTGSPLISGTASSPFPSHRFDRLVDGVSGGSTCPANTASSKPTTATSSGITRRPAAAPASRPAP